MSENEEQSVEKMQVYQIKTTTGEEILCHVPDQKNLSSTGKGELLIMHALALEPAEEGYVTDQGLDIMYFMRPWMLYQSDISTPVVVQQSGIVASYVPDQLLQQQFLSTITEIYKRSAEVMEQMAAQLDSDKPVQALPPNILSFPPKPKGS